LFVSFVAKVKHLLKQCFAVPWLQAWKNFFFASMNTSWSRHLNAHLNVLHFKKDLQMKWTCSSHNFRNWSHFAHERSATFGAMFYIQLTWGHLKNILVRYNPPNWEKSGPKIVGWPLLEQTKNVPPSLNWMQHWVYSNFI